MDPRDRRTGVRRLLRLPLRSGSQIDRDADDELRAFLAERVDDLVATGLSPEDAHREALRRLGASVDDAASSLHNSAMTRERRMRIREMVGDLRQDLRYAFRALRRDAGFTAFAVAIVALGIGASATVFSVASALLLRPLPFANPERLVWIQNGNEPGLSSRTAQVGHYLSFAKENRSMADVAGYFAFYGPGDMKLAVDGDNAIRLSAVPVTQNFFPLLGVQPILGRGFTAEESVWNGPKTALLSHALWKRQFASDPNIAGKTVTLNGAPTTVVGVLPASFDFGSVFAPGTRIDLFTAFPLTEETNRWGNTLAIVGRLKPGSTLASANAELKILGPQIQKQIQSNNFAPTVSSLRDHVSGQTRSGLIVLMLAVGVVMLIVCANLSNLLLARATTRQKEMAIRAALGAGRRRLVRQMLTESVVLSSIGAALGLILAVAGTRAIARMDAVSLPLLGNVGVDATALGFTALLAIAAGLAFGIAPALQVSEAHVHETLKASGRSATDGKRGQTMRRSLVVSEIALACVLLVGSGLLVRSFLKVLDVNLGFRPEHVAAVRVDPDENFTAAAPFVAYLNEVLRLARATPGVSSATIADGLPLGRNRTWGIAVGGAEYVKGKWQGGFIRIATDGFVDAMGMTVVSGRDFTAHDVETSEKVVVINETAAKTLWPNGSALDKMVRVGSDDRRVVGIVADVKHLAVEQDAGNQVYLPLRQVFDFSSLILVVRTSIEPAALAPTLRKALAPVVPRLATNEIQTLQGAVDKAVSPRRFFTALIGGFTMFALALALLGIYGVVSYNVTHRTQEIGVRIALGASAAQVQGRIIRETIQLALAGIALGTVGAWFVGRTLSGFLFGVTAADPVTYVAMVVVLSAVAVASGFLPARRASRIDPIVALREG
jgi:predicted permease